MSENEIDELRRRFAREAMALMERKGEEVSRTRLAAELGIARARIDAVFPEESDLLEAVTAEWFAPKLAVMDEVMASDLPPPRKMYEFFARRFILPPARVFMLGRFVCAGLIPHAGACLCD